MPRSLPLFAALLGVSVSLSAQLSTSAKSSDGATLEIAKAEGLNITDVHVDANVMKANVPEVNAPDAPSTSISTSTDGFEQSGIAPSAGKAGTAVAPKYAGIILPGQGSVPLSAGNKVVYSLHDAFNPYAFIGLTISAAYSYGLDSAPHFGSGGPGFGKREGASALRNTVQTISTDALFSPLFHDDPRYYELGQGHSFVARALYAATRVVVTRSDSGHNRLNAPLLLGYGVAAGVNNTFYPDQDTGASATLKNYAGSLGGAAIAFEANEFLDDALRMFRLRK